MKLVINLSQAILHVNNLFPLTCFNIIHDFGYHCFKIPMFINWHNMAIISAVNPIIRKIDSNLKNELCCGWLVLFCLSIPWS